MVKKFVVGNYVVEINTIDSGDTVRINKLYVNKISSVYDGMLLSEWVTYEAIIEMVKGDTGKEVVLSRQPRKRLRRFNIHSKQA